MSTNDPLPVPQEENVVAHFHDREDAERAIIELREEGFAANAIDAVFVKPPGPRESLEGEQKLPVDHAITTEAGAPGNTASKAAASVLPDIPFTTMTGGSPFGEASTYIPDERNEKPDAGLSTISVRTSPDQCSEAKSILERNNGVLIP
ncbi:MAG TPA: hypothetical protein VGD64_09695 [Acidisarcina sp.]